MDTIYLKCNRCNDAHLYQINENTIVVLEAEWREVSKNGCLLAHKPKVGYEYQLLIQGPLKINLNNSFYSVYMNPNAAQNGFESEDDIQSICFCLNQTLEVVSTTESSVLLKARVISVHELSERGNLDNPEVDWMKLLPENLVESDYYQVSNFENYTLIDFNFQSDLGLILVIKKQNSQSWIVAVNEWDFHKNLWYSCSRKLTKEEEDKYGTRH